MWRTQNTHNVDYLVRKKDRNPGSTILCMEADTEDGTERSVGVT
jgi:hypothetical protein